MKPLEEVAESYFNTLNPIAERISADIVAIKGVYEDLWNCLNTKEKSQIINETVIHPEAVLKYTLTAKSCEGVNLDVPLLTHQVTGSKYIVDESTGLSWRDEHSGPFSWKTPSQIDLSLFTSAKEEIQTDNKSQTCNNNNGNHNNKTKENNYFGLSQTDNIISSFSNSEDYCTKKFNKKKDSSSFSSNNVVFVGTSSKLSGLCSKLKFLPGKSYSYQVQTVVTNPCNDGGFLEKLKSSAVFKLQNTLKLVGGKSSTDKKVAEYKETETLVQPKTATVVRLSKPSPKIAKPKFPPPPPPSCALMSAKKNEDKDEYKTGQSFLLIRNSKIEKCQDEKDLEKATLLGENSIQSFLSADPDSLEQELQSKVTHELSDDFNSISTECTPLSGPSTDVIPKSGFDFLDNCFPSSSSKRHLRRRKKNYV